MFYFRLKVPKLKLIGPLDDVFFWSKVNMSYYSVPAKAD